MNTRNPSPSDGSDAEWAVVAPYLTLLPEDGGQRYDDLREVDKGLRWLVRTAATGRMMPHDLPPWYSGYQQTQRWLVERSFAWVARFRRLARDYERLPATVAGLHLVAFGLLALLDFRGVKNVAKQMRHFCAQPREALQFLLGKRPRENG